MEVFVGRQGELTALETAKRDAVAGVPRLVMVTGPPGIGKSALLRAFVAGCGDLTVRRASGDEADREQAACGVAPKRSCVPSRDLTPHERTVATLVASA